MRLNQVILDALNNILESEGVSKVDPSYFEILCLRYDKFIADTAQAVGSDINATCGLKGSAAPWGVQNKLLHRLMDTPYRH